MASSFFLVSLIGVTILLVAFIIVLLATGRGNVGKNVANMIKENKPLEEILEVGKKKKWNERELKMYFLLYAMQDFVKGGYNLDEVESMALDSGWPKDMIDIVVVKLK